VIFLSEDIGMFSGIIIWGHIISEIKGLQSEVTRRVGEYVDINYRIYEIIKLIQSLAERKQKRALVYLCGRTQFNAEMWYTKITCL